MLIVIPKDSLLPLLFPGLPASAEEQDILRALRKQYTIGDYTPGIQIKSQQVVIDFDESKAQAAKETHKRIIVLSEKGQYAKARQLLEPIIQKGAINSDLHRIYGQILYDEGQPDAAMDSFIEALRWNPENNAALIIVGNLYAQVQNDTETALQFFRRAVDLDPEDHVALNNMAGLLAKQGKLQEARKHFQRVLELEPGYPQAAYGIALLHDQEGELLPAFDWAIRALKASTGKHQRLAPTCVQLAEQVAQAYLEATLPGSLYQPFLDALAARSPRPIRVEENTDIPNIAKILVAEYRNIDAHTVQYQPGAPFATHLIMHASATSPNLPYSR